MGVLSPQGNAQPRQSYYGELGKSLNEISSEGLMAFPTPFSHEETAASWLLKVSRGSHSCPHGDGDGSGAQSIGFHSVAVPSWPL